MKKKIVQNFFSQLLENKVKSLILFLLLVAIIFSIVFFFVPRKNSNDLFSVQNNSDTDNRFGFSRDTEEFLKSINEKNNSENYTDNLIAKYGMQIAANNPDGPQNDKVVVPSHDYFETMIAEELQRGILYPIVSESDIRKGTSDSREALTIYLKKITTIITQANSVVKTTDIQIQAQKTAETLKKATQELLAVEVPPSWISTHLQLLNFYQKKMTLFEAISALETDPLKGLLALEELKKIQIEELSLTQTLQKKINEVQ